MVAIEKENLNLKGVLPKDYARPSLDKHRFGELIDIIGKIGLGDEASKSKDILGRVVVKIVVISSEGICSIPSAGGSTCAI